MAKFEVVGAWRDSGEPACLRIRASDAEHAEAIAEDRGLRVDYAQPHRAWFLWTNVASITILCTIILVNHIRLHGLQLPWNLNPSQSAEVFSPNTAPPTVQPEARWPRTAISPPSLRPLVPVVRPSAQSDASGTTMESPSYVASVDLHAIQPSSREPAGGQQETEDSAPIIRILPHPDRPEPSVCPRCKGTAEVTCLDCAGEGRQEVTEVCRMDATGGCGGVGHRDCFACKGAATRRCTACGGGGGYRLENGKKRNCTYCDGSGRRPCLTCHRAAANTMPGLPGKGRIVCPRCGGAGKVTAKPDCPACTRGKTPCSACSVSSGA